PRHRQRVWIPRTRRRRGAPAPERLESLTHAPSPRPRAGRGEGREPTPPASGLGGEATRSLCDSLRSLDFSSPRSHHPPYGSQTDLRATEAVMTNPPQRRVALVTGASRGI